MTLPPSNSLTLQRDGEAGLDVDPAHMPHEAGIVFIGRIRSPWKTRAECPKNMGAARATGSAATIEIGAPYRPGLAGLEGYSHIILLSWFDNASRNLIVQKPRHAAHSKGVFAIRSPVRPNPIGLHIAKLDNMDIGAGLLTIDAIDLLDGTPVLDIKPYLASTDAFPDALRPDRPGQ
jgi:tRNA-Thr(GGU) m(6)t(6)A37 methyltransferase TsaA